MDSDKYDGMFSINPEQNRTLLDDGKSVQHTRPKNIHPYDFVNENIYDTKGNLITEAKQITYNSEFIIRLCNIYILDVEPFLNHHFVRTPDKNRFLDYVEFGVLHDKHIKDGVKAKMQSWVNEKRGGGWKIDPVNPLQSWHLLIDVVNQFLGQVFYNGDKGLKALTHKLYSIDKITVTIEKAKAEIQAKYLTPESKETIVQIVDEGLKKLHASAQDLIDQYKMNHADNARKFILFFEASQLMVWDFEDWFCKLTGRDGERNSIGMEETSEHKTSKKENTNWHSIPLTVIEDHFRIMTKAKSTNGAPFLSEAVLNAFIKKAFQNDSTISKQKINYVKGEKSYVIKRFYELFDLAVKEYGEIDKKEMYINLVYDSFNNLGTKESIVSLFKPNKTAKKW